LKFDERKEEPQIIWNQANWNENSVMPWWSTNENLQKMWQPPITTDDSLNTFSNLGGEEQLQFGQMSFSDGNNRLQSDEMSLPDRNERFQFGEMSLSDRNKQFQSNEISLSDKNERFQFGEMSQSEPEQQPEEKPLDPMIQSLLGQLRDCGAQIPNENDSPTFQNLALRNPTFQNPTSRAGTYGWMETSGAMTVQMLESLQTNTFQNNMEPIIVKNQISTQNPFRSTTSPIILDLISVKTLLAF
jgi:hypothetical protein